jgi:hypothetical protein
MSADDATDELDRAHLHCIISARATLISVVSICTKAETTPRSCTAVSNVEEGLDSPAFHR